MDRINRIGKNLISFKLELAKHYSPLVDDSLMMSLDRQLESKIINQETLDLIINDSINMRDFEKYLLTKREYLKSKKEMEEEFESIRKIVNNSLVKLGFTDFIETECNVANNMISVLKQYNLSEEFIKVYFGLKDEEMVQIMKKKGFAEKFAVLRLTKVFKEIASEMRVDEAYAQGFSKVYYNSDINGFAVDYKYHINVDAITEESIDEKIQKIKDADRVVERKFLKKTGINFYNLRTLVPAPFNHEIMNAKPNNKTTEVLVEKDEKQKILEVISNNENVDTKDVPVIDPAFREKPNVFEKATEHVLETPVKPEIRQNNNVDNKNTVKAEIPAPKPLKEEYKESVVKMGTVEPEIDEDTKPCEVPEFVHEVSNDIIEEDTTDEFSDFNRIEVPDNLGDVDLGEPDIDNIDIDDYI